MEYIDTYILHTLKIVYYPPAFCCIEEPAGGTIRGTPPGPCRSEQPVSCCFCRVLLTTVRAPIIPMTSLRFFAFNTNHTTLQVLSSPTTMKCSSARQQTARWPASSRPKQASTRRRCLARAWRALAGPTRSRSSTLNCLTTWLPMATTG